MRECVCVEREVQGMKGDAKGVKTNRGLEVTNNVYGSSCLRRNEAL